MASKKLRWSCGGKEGEESNNMGTDRISELPDPLIHHILSFLPTLHVVRMSLLSKRWRNMWISVPVLNFIKSEYMSETNKPEKEMFLKFVDTYLSRRKHSMKFFVDTSISGFKLKNDYKKILNLHFAPVCKWDYSLPKFILNAKSLRLLNLQGLKLEAVCPISLPSLRVLSLKDVIMDREMLQNIICGCPIIEDLDLSDYCSTLCDIDLAVSGTLRKLSLTKVELNDGWLENQITRLPFLERLALNRSVGWYCLSINSKSLKSFSLYGIGNISVKFATPSLVHFSYAGDAKTMFSFDAPNVLEANVDLRSHDTISSGTSCLQLLIFLSNFKFLKKMRLDISSEQALIVPEHVRKCHCFSPLTNLKHLKVKIFIDLNSDYTELRDTLLWYAPSVETLEIEQIVNPS